MSSRRNWVGHYTLSVRLLNSKNIYHNKNRKKMYTYIYFGLKKEGH